MEDNEPRRSIKVHFNFLKAHRWLQLYKQSVAASPSITQERVGKYGQAAISFSCVEYSNHNVRLG